MLRTSATWRPPLHGRRRWLLAILLLCLLASVLLAMIRRGGQGGMSAAVLRNPCTGEAIALRESTYLLPNIAAEQPGSRAVSLSAVGLSGVGDRGTYYLPMGTGKLVLTLTRASIELVAGGDLELIGRGSQTRDYRLHGLARLRASASGGLGGSGMTLQSRCSP